MANNVHRKGFRWHRSKDGSANPVVRKISLASGYRPTITSAGPVTNYFDLRPGMPIKRLSTGYGDIAGEAESTTPSTEVLGIVAGFEPLYLNGKMTPQDYYPNEGITYGSVVDRISWVLYYPADTAYFEVDVDDAVTATTYAGYLAFIGENVQHIFNVATDPEADTMVDISGHATTNTFLWRIEDVKLGDPNNQDFSGSYVKIIVSCNFPQIGTVAPLGI